MSQWPPSPKANVASAFISAYAAGVSIWSLLETNRRTKVDATVKMMQQQTEAAACLTVIGTFKYAHTDYAEEFYKQKRSCQMDDTVKEVDRCRKVTQNFFHSLWYLYESDTIDQKYMEEKAFAESGNFKTLVEPLEKKNFMILTGKGEEYYYQGKNRPAVFGKIEAAMKAEKTKTFFGVTPSDKC